MSERLGSFPDDHPIKPYLAISLSRLAADRTLCHRTARFVAAFVAARYVGNDHDSIIGAVDFIVNELLENAVKFGSKDDIHIAVGNTHNQIVCLVENQVEAARGPALHVELTALTSAEPGELLRRRAEGNAEGGDGSGLGLLIIMHDYGARINWHLTTDNLDTLRVRIVARLPFTMHERECDGDQRCQLPRLV
jgi:hypothetical protein